MAQNSKIEWTDHTVNLWWGCSKVHEGCDNCYAEYLSDTRYKNDLWGKNKARKMIKSAFPNLEKFQKLAESENKIHRVFIGSMMDIFEKPMPLLHPVVDGDTGDLRWDLFYRISKNHYPNLLFLFLTKRPSNINKYIPESWKENQPKNVMFGTSVSTQKNAERLVPQLLQVKGYKFLSVEPQLDSVDLTKIVQFPYHIHNVLSGITKSKILDTAGEFVETSDFGKIDWIIQGGESGHNKRPFNLDWAYKLKEQCQKAGVPYFFKQIDKVQPIPEDLMVREFPKIL